MAFDDRGAQRLCRDPRNGRIMGVCAGIADYFDWNATFVRILAVIALVWFTVLTLIVYVALGFMLPADSERSFHRGARDERWRGGHRPTDDTFGDCSVNLRRMESCVTSARYDLEREFRDLEK
ncbi:MAG: PspC domain-containing protein [Rhodanobacteraceae bacterium]